MNPDNSDLTIRHFIQWQYSQQMHWRSDATANRLVVWLSWDCCANTNRPEWVTGKTPVSLRSLWWEARSTGCSAYTVQSRGMSYATLHEFPRLKHRSVLEHFLNPEFSAIIKTLFLKLWTAAASAISHRHTLSTTVKHKLARQYK
jgi:hypothetical protein